MLEDRLRRASWAELDKILAPSIERFKGHIIDSTMKFDIRLAEEVISLP